MWRGFALLLALAVTFPVFASDPDEDDLPIPRYVSLKSPKANMRVGPGENFPILWIYERRGLPLEVIDQHHMWRKVRDSEGDEGWVLKSLLSGTRHAVIQMVHAPLFRQPDTKSGVAFYAEKNVIMKIEECRKDWCYLSLDRRKGWVPTKAIWGILPGEQVGK